MRKNSRSSAILVSIFALTIIFGGLFALTRHFYKAGVKANETAPIVKVTDEKGADLSGQGIEVEGNEKKVILTAPSDMTLYVDKSEAYALNQIDKDGKTVGLFSVLESEFALLNQTPTTETTDSSSTEAQKAPDLAPGVYDVQQKVTGIYLKKDEPLTIQAVRLRETGGAIQLRQVAKDGKEQKQLVLTFVDLVAKAKSEAEKAALEKADNDRKAKEQENQQAQPAPAQDPQAAPESQGTGEDQSAGTSSETETTLPSATAEAPAATKESGTTENQAATKESSDSAEKISDAEMKKIHARIRQEVIDAAKRDAKKAAETAKKSTRSKRSIASAPAAEKSVNGAARASVAAADGATADDTKADDGFVPDQQNKGGLHITNNDFYWDPATRRLTPPTAEHPANVRYSYSADEVNTLTGTGPFDSTAGAGKDTSASDQIVRTKDAATYNLKLQINRIDGGQEQFTGLPTMYPVPIMGNDPLVGDEYDPAATFKNVPYTTEKQSNSNNLTSLLTFTNDQGFKATAEVSGPAGNTNSAKFTITGTGQSQSLNYNIQIPILPNGFKLPVAFGLTVGNPYYYGYNYNSLFGLLNNFQPLEISQKGEAQLINWNASRQQAGKWSTDDKVGTNDIVYNIGIASYGYNNYYTKGSGVFGMAVNSFDLTQSGTFNLKGGASGAIPMGNDVTGERYLGRTTGDVASGSGVYFDPTSKEDWQATSSWKLRPQPNQTLPTGGIYDLYFKFNDLGAYDKGGALNPDRLDQSTTRTLTMSNVDVTDFFGEPVEILGDKTKASSTSWSEAEPPKPPVGQIGEMKSYLHLLDPKNYGDPIYYDYDSRFNTFRSDKTAGYFQALIDPKPTSSLVYQGFLYNLNGAALAETEFTDTVQWAAFNNQSYALTPETSYYAERFNASGGSSNGNTVFSVKQTDSTGKETFVPLNTGDDVRKYGGKVEYGVPKQAENTQSEDFLRNATQDDFDWKYATIAAARKDPKVQAYRVVYPEKIYIPYRQQKAQVNFTTLTVKPEYMGNTDKEGDLNLLVAHNITNVAGQGTKDYLNGGTGERIAAGYNAFTEDPATWNNSRPQSPGTYDTNWLAYTIAPIKIFTSAGVGKGSVNVGEENKYTYSFGLSTSYPDVVKNSNPSYVQDALKTMKIKITGDMTTYDYPFEKDFIFYKDKDGVERSAVLASDGTLDLADPANKPLMDLLYDNYLKQMVNGNSTSAQVDLYTKNFVSTDYSYTDLSNTTAISGSMTYLNKPLSGYQTSGFSVVLTSGLSVYETIAPKAIGALGSAFDIKVYPTVSQSSEKNVRGVVPVMANGVDGNHFDGDVFLTDVKATIDQGKKIDFYYSTEQNIEFNPRDPLAEGGDKNWVKWDGMDKEALKKAKSIGYVINGDVNNQIYELTFTYQTNDNQIWDRYRHRSSINSDSRYPTLTLSNYVQYLVYDNGGLKLKKLDGETGAPVAGATFVAAESQEDADAIKALVAKYTKDFQADYSKKKVLYEQLVKDITPYVVRNGLKTFYNQYDEVKVNPSMLDRLWKYLQEDYPASISKNPLDFNKDGKVDDADKELLKKGQLPPYTVTTDANGEATFDNLMVNNGGTPKNYWVVEIDTPAGFALDATPHQGLVEKDKVTPLTKAIYNDRLRNKVKILKKDGASGEGLAGAGFVFVRNQADVAKAFAIIQQMHVAVKTAEAGADLAAIKEPFLKQLEPYVMKSYEDTNYGLNSFDTELAWSINQTDLDGNGTIDTADKTLWLADQYNHIFVATSGSDGTVTANNLAVNDDYTDTTYYAVEMDYPDGYSLDSEGTGFTISPDKAAEITINNMKSKVTINKLDTQNYNLKGAEFEIYDAQGNKVTKDSDGKDIGRLITQKGDNYAAIVVNNLPFGKYKLREIKAPEGHELMGVDKEFELKKDSQQTAQITIDIVDQPFSQLPFTGGDNQFLITAALIAVSGMLVTSGIYLLHLDQRRRKE